MGINDANSSLSDLYPLAKIFGVFVFRGDIAVASDFPTLAEVRNGWVYRIVANVTDNDPTRTNTGQSFRTDDVIVWNGINWTDITGFEVWKDDTVDVKTINDPRNVNLQSAGLKDNNVTTPLKIGDSLSLIPSTTNKTIIGAINELNLKFASAFVDQSGGTGDTYGILSGAIDGVNTTYAVSFGEYQQGSLRVFRNGKLQIQGTAEDWVETLPSAGTFDFNVAPLAGEQLTAVYNLSIPGIPVIADTEIVANKVWSSLKINNHIANAKVYIRSEADFPAPVGGFIDLIDNTTYAIDAKTIVLTNILRLPTGGDVKIEGTRPLSVLYYVGSGSAISGNNINSLFMKDTTVIAPFGSIWNVTGRYTDASYIVCHLCVFQAANLGSVHDIAYFYLNGIYQGFSQGISFKDNLTIAHVSMNFFATNNTPGCVYFSFEGTIPYITISTLLLTSFGSNETLFNFDPAMINVSSTFSGINASGAGTIFKAGSLDQTHLPFKFTACVNIADSTAKSQTFLSDNVLITNIPAQNAWIIINGGTNYTFSETERMTGITDGGIKYIGLEDVSLAADANVNLEPSTATKNLESAFMIIQNGTISLDVTFTNATNIVNRIGHGLSNDDIIIFKNTAGTLPVELRKDVIYYIINATADTFQLSYTMGGAIVTFTDDGTPPNNYSDTTVCGGTGRANISAGNPVDVIPQALLALKTNHEVYMAVRNTIDAVNILVGFTYFRLRK